MHIFSSYILTPIFWAFLSSQLVFGDDNGTDFGSRNGTFLEENTNQTNFENGKEPGLFEPAQLNSTNITIIIEDSRRIIASLESERGNLLQEIEKLRQENEKSRLENQTLRQENEKIRQENEKLRQENEKSRLENQTLRMENENLRLQIENLRPENDRLHHQIQDWMKDQQEQKKFMEKNVIADPVVKLYSGENYTGHFEEFDFGAADHAGVTCQNQWYWRVQVKSVDTSGKCIRLFRHPSCEGLSVAIYPGSGNSHSVLTLSGLTQVRSIGRCLDYELQFDVQKQTFGKNISDPNHIPDVLELYSWVKSMAQTTVNNSKSLQGYKLGPKQRLEFVHAWVSPKHLNISQSGMSMEQGSKYYKSLDQKPGDILGFGIPVSIGGPTDETYNVFPQTVSGQREWLRVISGVRQFVKQYQNPVRMGLNFQYQNNSTRPDLFYYYVEYRYGSFKHEYGRILN